jgi:hypothetical protein
MQWSKNELRVVFDYLRKNGPQVQALCQTLDMTKGQVDGIRRRYPEEWAEAVDRFHKANPKLDPDVQAKAIQQNLRLQAQKTELQREVKALAREKTVLEELRDLVEESLPALDVPLDLPDLVTVLPDETTVETMVVNIGDLHGGEKVAPERVKFMNEYNSEVCRARFGHYIETHLKIKEKLESSGGWYYPELVVNLLGDIVSGTIHEIENHSDHTIIKTCMGMARMLAEGIAYLARHYPTVHVMGVVGNHGRLPDQRKKNHKEPERNWDYLIYLSVAQYLKDYSNVRCHFPSAYSIQMDIRGWRFQLAHFDDVKSWGGLPAYGLDRYARNQNSGEAMRGEHIDYFIGGHFHQKVEMDVGGAEVIVNGDMKGTDEWVQGFLGKNGCPRQSFFAVHEEHGITHRWDIKLANPSPDAPRFTITPWDECEQDETGAPIIIYKVA